jgi:type III restriction enzyme
MRHHYYPQVGKFDSGEEEQTAWHLEQLCAAGKLSFWVRNLVRKGSASFFLQKATYRFYPDFLARLTDGRTLSWNQKPAASSGTWRQMTGRLATCGKK